MLVSGESQHPSSSIRNDEESRRLGDLEDRSRHRRIFKSFGKDRAAYTNMISIQCSETPVFFCDEDSRTLCGNAVLDEQDRIIQEIHSKHPDAVVVARTHKLVNAVFMNLPTSATFKHEKLGRIAGVKKVMMAHTMYKPQLQDAVEYIGAISVEEKYCATGKGVRRIVDTGIDYTHEALGGIGTAVAYRKAYGRNESSVENTKRDGLFPTERVVEGYDFLGELFDFTGRAYPDDDPIDYIGHGTVVASTIAAVAPDVELVAVNVCSPIVGCPQFVILQGLEYALDPNGDNSTDDKVSEDIPTYNVWSPRCILPQC